MMTSDWRVGRGDASLWFVVVIVVMVMRIFMTVKLTTMYMIVVGHVVGDISCISVVTCMVFDHSYIHRPEFEPAHTHKYFQCKIILCIVFCLCPMLLDLFCPAPPLSPHNFVQTMMSNANRLNVYFKHQPTPHKPFAPPQKSTNSEPFLPDIRWL